jgi:hypothetical protein
MSAKRKPPLYVTPNCGIEVIGECPTSDGRYIRCYIRPHPMFSGTTVLRARVVMTDLLGRKLLRNEHAHHGAEGRHVDTQSNLTLLSAAEHNSHHKTGSKHSAAAKRKISAGLRHAHAEGRRTPVDPTLNTHHLVEWHRKLRAGEVVASWAKPERNARLIAFHKECRSLKATAEHFGISQSSAWEIIKKYAPSQLRPWRRRS